MAGVLGVMKETFLLWVLESQAVSVGAISCCNVVSWPVTITKCDVEYVYAGNYYDFIYITDDYLCSRKP